MAQRQCPKILVTGTHSTGKTTLVSALVEQLDLPSIDIVTEPARDSPFILNFNQNQLSTVWLLVSLLRAEIEAETRPGTGMVICDRGLPDILAYHQVTVGDGLATWSAVVTDWMSSYAYTFVTRPDPGIRMVPDALRPDDPTFRSDVQQAIERWLAASGTPYEVLPHGLGDRVERVRARLFQGAVPS